VSWLPDGLFQMYTGLQQYKKRCLEVMTMASPLKKGLMNELMLRPERNSS
jgi:hypothetical protein